MTFSTRQRHVLVFGVLAGLLLSLSCNIMLGITQSLLNYLLTHGVGDFSGQWTGSGPITQLFSAGTFILVMLAGAIGGLGIGLFAATLVPQQATNDVLQSPSPSELP